MKGDEFGHRRPRREESCGQKVRGIPDTILAERSPNHPKTNVDEASRQASSNSRRYWVNLKRQPRSMLVAGQLIRFSYCRAPRGGKSRNDCRDKILLLVGEDVSGPTDTAA